MPCGGVPGIGMACLGRVRPLMACADLDTMGRIKPGDTIHVVLTVEDCTPTSKPGRGVVTMTREVVNQRDDIVMTQDNSVMFGRRDAGALETAIVPTPRPAAPSAEAVDPAPQQMTLSANPFLEYLVVGTRDERP